MKIGLTKINKNNPIFTIAEIGINHNGDIKKALRLIKLCKDTGFDSVKFQKRNPDICVPENQKGIERDTPWGRMTYIEYKHKIEFGNKEYDIIDNYCKENNIVWFASVWDIDSLNFFDNYNIPVYKVPSACITDMKLVKSISKIRKPTIISTGMSTTVEIDEVVKLFEPNQFALLHCCSAYPSPYEDLNLRAIRTLKKRYKCNVGYSGHESGIATSVAAGAIGAEIIERHVTLDRATWGTDQAASLGPSGMEKFIRDLRLVEKSMGNGEIYVRDSELPIREKLRKY